MKRMSIAEQTLKKQIDRLRLNRTYAQQRKREIESEISLMDREINTMEDEMTRLENSRKAASLRNTPRKLHAL